MSSTSTEIRTENVTKHSTNETSVIPLKVIAKLIVSVLLPCNRSEIYSMTDVTNVQSVWIQSGKNLPIFFRPDIVDSVEMTKVGHTYKQTL